MLTVQGDPQRKDRKLKATPATVSALTASTPAVILTDQDVPGWVTVPSGGLSPYFERWIVQRRYLLDHPEIRWAWCVDATDVTMLREPWDHMEPGTLYVGSEAVVTDNAWLRKHHPRYNDCFDQHATQPLLNCGLVGGDRETVLEFLTDMVHEIGDGLAEDPKGMGFDMGPFNFVCRTRWNDRLVTGPQVHTVFKAGKDNGCAWWQHK